MKYETIIALTSPTRERVDFDAPNAAMRLAWIWTAQELWTRRLYDADHKHMFARHLRTAWTHVKMPRENARKAKLARADQRIRDLNEQRKMLQNKSFMISINAEQSRIDAEIRQIMDTL